jgi:hypothetical protein
MGGIVVKCVSLIRSAVAKCMSVLKYKQAYMLAKQDKHLQSIADRIHTLYFIATPHRGADSARLLRNLISVSPLHSAKAYIADLVPNSRALQIINDQFPHVCQGLRLWSFFETLKTNLGKSQELIVEKDSAVLGTVSSL